MSVRIYQLARQLNIDNKKLIDLLREQGMDVKSPSSTIPNIYAEDFIKNYKPSEPEPEKKPSEAPKKLAQTPKAVKLAVQDNKITLKPKTFVPTLKPSQTGVEVKEKESEAASVKKAVKLSDKSGEKIESQEISQKGGPSKSTVSSSESQKIQLKVPPFPSKPTPTAAPVVAPFPSTQPRWQGAFVRSAAEIEAEKQRRLDAKKALVTRPQDKVVPQISTFRVPAPKPPIAKIIAPPKMIAAPKAPILDKPLEGAANEAEGKVASEGEKRTLVIKPPIIVSEFANLLGIKPFRLISELMQMGIFAFMNQPIDEEVAQKVADKYNVEVVFKHRTQPGANAKKELEELIDESKFLEPRPPIVCILGHVDHGKTTLLDYIRKSNVVAKEAGGITQHVGAYQVTYNEKKITFLDTPGHAAFSKMRQRGANVTDIAILVVAADDGFMPQTDEALNFAKKENVPVIVAINKIDAKGANIDRVKQQMQKRGITSEDWGGETLCVGISALNGTHVDELLEAILLQAEMMELKANPRCPAEGIVIESRVDIGRGPTATVIINKGTLKTGDSLVCDAYYCKARALLNENGEKLKEAPPSTPVQIIGWSGIPNAGAHFTVAKNEKEAKRSAEDFERLAKQIEAAEDDHKVSSVDELMAALEANKQKVLKVIVRADVRGSVEAVVDFLKTIKSNKISLEIIDADVGPINLNDVKLAHASEATLVAFNTNVESAALHFAKQHQIQIIRHNIIYELIQQVTDAMRGLLEPEWVENKLGSAEIRQIFPLAKSEVAGCMVVAGKLVRDASVRLLRHNKVLLETKIQMLKRFKDDVTEVKSGYECGVQLADNSIPYEVRDVIECFETIAKLAAL